MEAKELEKILEKTKTVIIIFNKSLAISEVFLFKVSSY